MCTSRLSASFNFMHMHLRMWHVYVCSPNFWTLYQYWTKSKTKQLQSLMSIVLEKPSFRYVIQNKRVKSGSEKWNSCYYLVTYTLYTWIIFLSYSVSVENAIVLFNIILVCMVLFIFTKNCPNNFIILITSCYEKL